MDYSRGDEFEDAGTRTSLFSITDAFEEISNLIIDGRNGDFPVLKLNPFCDACSFVRDLEEALERYVSLSSVVDYDVKWKIVKSRGSHTHNLRRVRRDAASSAYQQVCAPYHSWAVRTAFSAGICALPSREQLLLNLNETG
uniref:Glycolipid transfer protein domain-containing protein n=1 Tax=Lactuca sativa TaxID=4236 RepID=A0A9R1XW46_LACSA|nr:hypothetical protein LSAT_V11C200066580 [Lactuca sativa]